MSRRKKKVDSFETWVQAYGDCPEKLFQMATTEFEKAVAVEFYEIHSKMDKQFARIEEAITWCKWLITGMFGVTLLTFIATNFQAFLRLFGWG